MKLFDPIILAVVIMFFAAAHEADKRASYCSGYYCECCDPEAGR